MKQARKEEMTREALQRLRERIVVALLESKSRTPDELLREIKDVAEDCRYAAAMKRLEEAMKDVKVTPGEPVYFNMSEEDGDKSEDRGRNR